MMAAVMQSRQKKEQQIDKSALTGIRYFNTHVPPGLSQGIFERQNSNAALRQWYLPYLKSCPKVYVRVAGSGGLIVKARVLYVKVREWGFTAIEMQWHYRGDYRYRMPESLRAFCSIVSLTAAKTSRMFEVSVACVRWGYRFRCARLTWLNLHNRYFAARLTSLPPE